MSWAWSLPLSAPPRSILKSPTLRLECTRVVMPTFRDWDEARETVDGLLACSPRPAEIVVVDDNGEGDPPSWTRRHGVLLVRYPNNRGPSFARNAGAAVATRRPIDWLYFTDTCCLRASDFFLQLIDATMNAGPRCIAAAGPVHGMARSEAAMPINHYMTVQGILNPPMDDTGPQAIVTANALICSAAFASVGGFDLSYPFAAGEDLDLGVRLRRLGSLAWASHAIVYHRFNECQDDFRRRFIRYGRGTAHLEHRLALPNIRPTPILAGSATLQYLADLQAESMVIGYDRHMAALRPVAASPVI